MTSKITESEIEKYAIELIEKQGYQYIYVPSIAPDSLKIERLNSPVLILYNDFIVANQLIVRNNSPSGDSGAKFLESFSTAKNSLVVQVEGKGEVLSSNFLRNKIINIFTPPPKFLKTISMVGL